MWSPGLAVSKAVRIDYNRLMIWVRRGLVFILSVALFVALIGEALSVSANINLTKPAKLVSWLNQSHVYTSLVDNAIHDAQQNASNDTGAGRVSLSDPAVVGAVKTVFSASVVQQYSSTFINSNYAWLQGKTSTPDFKIDLTGSKQQLATFIGQAVQTKLSALPACTAAQLAQLQSTLNTDPLTLPCNLPGISPETAGQQAAQQITDSSDFLNKPVLTASSFNPNGGNQGQPYYQKLRHLPKLYRLSQKLPLIFGVIAVISILGIIFISLTRRRGIRRLGWVLLASGAALVLLKFAADSLFNQLQKKIFNNSNITLLQKSLTDFMHRVENQLVKIDLYFGIALLVLAAIVFIYIWLTRGKSGGPKPKDGVKPVAPGTVFHGEPEPTPGPAPAPTPSKPRPKPPIPPLKRPSVPPKRPRLIQ